MKKMMILAFVSIVSTGLFAQEKPDTGMHKKMDHKMMGMKKDCVMMKDGKMIQMKDGKDMALAQDITMSDGSVVMVDGNLKKKDGTTVMLKNGDCVMMDGNVKHKDMTKKKDM